MWKFLESECSEKQSCDSVFVLISLTFHGGRGEIEGRKHEGEGGRIRKGKIQGNWDENIPHPTHEYTEMSTLCARVLPTHVSHD